MIRPARMGSAAKTPTPSMTLGPTKVSTSNMVERTPRHLRVDGDKRCCGPGSPVPRRVRRSGGGRIWNGSQICKSPGEAGEPLFGTQSRGSDPVAGTPLRWRPPLGTASGHHLPKGGGASVMFLSAEIGVSYRLIRCRSPQSDFDSSPFGPNDARTNLARQSARAALTPDIRPVVIWPDHQHCHIRCFQTSSRQALLRMKSHRERSSLSISPRQLGAVSPRSSRAISQRTCPW